MTEAVPNELLRYRITASSYEEFLEPDDEPDALVTRLPFELRQGNEVVAQAHVLKVRVDAADRYGFSIAEVFDSVDQDLHELYCAIYDEKTGEILEGLAEPCGLQNVLYIDTVKVVANRRGQGLGLKFVDRIRELSADGCAIVALRVHPLTWENPKHPDQIDRDVFTKRFACEGSDAKAKLRAYWSRLGFKQVSDTDFMVFDMSEEPPTLT